MVSQVSGRFPVAEGRGHLQGQSATIERSNGKRGLITFDFSRSVGGPRKSKARRKPTPTTSNWRSQMTLIKSLLLGSAAGIVAVASAQAADLPTKKAAPVEYVKVCNVGGITGWTLPGSDTCVKFSGYITAQFEGGNLNTQYNYGSISQLTTTTAGTVLVDLGVAALSPSRPARPSPRVSPAPSHRYCGDPELPPVELPAQPARARLRASTAQNQTRTSFGMSSAGRPAPTSGSTSPRTPPTAP